MKKLLLVFMLINFASGCVWYEDNFHHDNGRKCGQRDDHCNVGHQGNKNHHHDDNDQGDNDQGDNGKHHDDHGKKSSKGKGKDKD